MICKRRAFERQSFEKHSSNCAALFAVVLILSGAGRCLLSQEQGLALRARSDRLPVPERLVAEARRMISEFKTTRYTHKTHIDPERGICEVDCSGFLVVILKQVAPEHLKLIPTKHQRPLAEDFYNAITAPDGQAPRAWRRIDRVEDAKPGDVITWLKLERQPGDNTGHVMLIAEMPVAESPIHVRVRVLDSTLHGHGHDTRPEGESGIGQGTIWLDVDSNGRPIGYHWKSRKGKLHEVPIAIGRAMPIAK